MKQSIKIVRTLLDPKKRSVKHKDITKAVDSALHIPQFKGLDKDQLIREVESLYSIQMDDFRIIELDERKIPWLGNIKSKIEWNFWSRYQEYLKSEKNYPPKVLSQIDKLTDSTLDNLFNPEEKIELSKRGLVVGQVQSGKTSNYIGLICKAADVGYKIIIVLAGLHNNLRSQTQIRVDQGFLGFDTQYHKSFDTQHHKSFDKINTIGVGRIQKESIAHSLTSSLERGDFTSNSANSLGMNFNIKEPIIAVVKKNTKILECLFNCLSALRDGKCKISDKSLLLIDDEADNASINYNKDEDDPTKTNSWIRKLLDLFYKSAYVGHTATPFANLFISKEELGDLFPRDFIINIPTPSNYMGPDKVFGIGSIESEPERKNVLPIINRINDHEHFNRHKREDKLPDRLPQSLETAIICFILTCAIREHRKQVNVHNSMLVHISRFTNWQRHIKELVEETFEYYRRGIEMDVPDVISKIRKIFEHNSSSYDFNGKEILENYKGYKEVSEYIEANFPDMNFQVAVHSWDDVSQYLESAVSKIQVKEINGGSGDTLNYYHYKNGLSVIAIGGNKLSRGLTLEGLSVSYYLRASRMYDTLMQMGRWFGYRHGYVDLCRLFISRELNEWFCHITLATEELRDEFDYMSDVAGSTPDQYLLRVRTHPGILQISASNKIRRATSVQTSWSGRLAESYQLQKNPDTISRNLNSTKDLIKSLSIPSSEDPLPKNHFLWKNVSVDLIKPFFQKFKVSEKLKSVEPLKLLKYIDESVKNNELVNWNVALVTDGMGKDYKLSINGIPKIKCVIRRPDDLKSDKKNFHMIKNRIIRPKDEFFDLEDNELQLALDMTKEIKKEYKNSFPAGYVVRSKFRDPKTALLIIYFIDAEEADIPDNSEPLIGFAISFPKSKLNHSVSYAANKELHSDYDTEDTE